MQVGISLPTADLTSPDAIRDFAQAAEGAGYDYVVSGEHVLGVSRERLAPGEQMQGTSDQVWRDPFVLFGFIAGATKTLGLTTGILVLPQRQTAVVAKQAAELDLVSGGRLRLGVGLGRNYYEYEALGENFKNRGRRLEEQVEVLRRLWTEPLVTFEGRWHHLDRMGINPLPIQRPIPIWFGTFVQQIVEPAIQRLGRLADGWLVGFPAGEELKAAVERMRGYAKEAGRDPMSVAIDGSLRLAPDSSVEDIARQVKYWQDLGASHVRVAGGGANSNLQQKIDDLIRLRGVLRDAGA
jgi:probable F420-dependent oxidoreductase